MRRAGGDRAESRRARWINDGEIRAPRELDVRLGSENRVRRAELRDDRPCRDALERPWSDEALRGRRQNHIDLRPGLHETAREESGLRRRDRAAHEEQHSAARERTRKREVLVQQRLWDIKISGHE